MNWHQDQDWRATGIDWTDVKEWPAPTVQQMRDCILLGRIAGLSPPEEEITTPTAPTEQELGMVCMMATEALMAGRTIHFGHWPAEVIRQCSLRGGPLFSLGALNQPFSDPWLMIHTWDQATAIYLVNPIDRDPKEPTECEVVELIPVLTKGNRVLLLGDRGVLLGNEEGEPDHDDYHCRIAPSSWRYVPGFEGMNHGESINDAAAGNIFDPLMTGLMILNTQGVERETIAPSAKLNRARVKSGKEPYPSYERVASETYVTAIMHRGSQRSEHGRGTHASPIPHLRRGHMRNLPSGARTFIRDTLVKMTPEALASFRSQRSHYDLTRFAPR